MKKIATKLDNYFKLPNPGLRAFLDRNEKGQPDDYETPLFHGKSMQEVLDGFVIKDGLIPGLIDFENEMKAKVGPMSVMKPFDEREEKLVEYYTLSTGDKAVPINPAALDAVIAEWKAIKGIRAMSKENTIKEMKLNTNSGSPYFAKRKLVVEKPVEGYLLAATLGWRGQEGGPTEDDTKQRIVWMFPFSVNVEELSVYKPIISGLQKHGLVPALISMDAVEERMTRLFDTKAKDDVVIATDFKGYDQTFNRYAQEGARYIWRGLGVPETWLDKIFPIKFNIPIVCTEHVTYTDEHGMGSGSGGTNTDECAEHRGLQYEAAIDNGQTLNPNSQAYGDDGVISYPGITVDQVIKSYTRHGHIMNETKQYVSETSTTYLRRYYHTDYRPDGVMRGVYSAYRALGRLRKQERFYDPEKWNSKLVIMRSYSILENCKWHPQFEQLVDYVITGDKYRLGLAIPGFLGSKTLTTLAKEAREELGDDFLGYTKTNQLSKRSDSDINNWRVVKYLRSKI